MRKALVVGLDYYSDVSSLTGCVQDATAVAAMLEKNHNGLANFTEPKLLTASDVYKPVSRRELRDAIELLFKDKSEIALLYFSGHGYVDETGGFLCASDCQDGHDGLSLHEVTAFAQASKAANKVIILDSCHSGVAADRPGDGRIAELTDGMTFLTASTADQKAYEGGNGAHGIFTHLLVDALGGAAANLVGDVTPGSLYAHIDQSLGPWGRQRPVFKTNVTSFVSLRKARPPIALDELLQLSTFFPKPGFIFALDPSFEPERTKSQLKNKSIPPPNSANTAIFKILQNYAKVNLLLPVDAPHMWHAAMGKQSCKLTALGEHYRRLVAGNLIKG